MEYWQANFDVIRNATAKGIIVVEGAGNGTMNLDSSIYDGRFDRNVRDSGAIMVGDAGPDVGVARRAGIPVIGVEFGYTDVPIAELRPDRLIGHFSDLPAAVSSLARVAP